MPYQTLKLERQGEIDIIRVGERRISLQISELFHEEMKRALEQSGTKLVVDLEEVHVMSSSGLGVLIAVREEMLNRGGKLVLCHLQPLMQEILTRMHLVDFFTIAPERQAALAQLRQG